MPRRNISKPTPDSSLTEAALDAMDAQELRDLIRDIIPWLDEKAHARMVDALVDRATRNRSGWAPAGPTSEVVADIVAFAAAARRVGYAQPGDIRRIPSTWLECLLWDRTTGLCCRSSARS